MTLPLFWILLGIVALIVELLSPHFGFVFVSLASFAAAAVCAVGLSLSGQVLTFVAMSVVLLALIRPRMVAKLGSRGVPSRTDTLQGKSGIVTDSLNADRGTGRVLVAGEDWAARSAAPIEAGARIRVRGADGIVLVVEPLENVPEA